MASISACKEQYELVVGLEVHVQLSTVSKIFSSEPAAFNSIPNQHVGPVSLGLPGTLPYLNACAIEYAIKMGLALDCAINLENRFDRKNYFYADLPKGYQITQETLPICKGGALVVATSNERSRTVRVNRIHLEEDAGKSIHDQDQDTLIDLNRAGVPLIEIVTEPDIRSAEEAGLFLASIQKLVRFLEISDGNMEEGSLRCDANISVRRSGDNGYGNRCEVKNINSIRNLQRAITFEFGRQVELLERGEYIEQNTLNFDAETGTTSPLRSKEMANDYRYFPEPDLPPVILSREYIDQIAAGLPELPDQLVQRLTNQYHLSSYDAALIALERETSRYFEEVVTFTDNTKAAANWLNGPVRSFLNEKGVGIDAFPVSPIRLAELIDLVSSGKVSFTVAAQELLPVMTGNFDATAMELAEQMNLLISTNQGELELLIEEVLQMYPDKVIEYKKGKKGVLGLFMGEFMKRSKGKADPKTASQLLVTKLEQQ